MNRIVYLLLLGLSVAAVPASRFLPAVMALSTAKFLMVGMGFMDLRRAHWLWRAGFSAFAILFVVVFTVLV